MDKLELLQKIKALAEKGQGGEKINAQKILAQLMEKYNISETELSDEVLKEFDIQTYNKWEQRLLYQVAYSVYGNIDESKVILRYTYKKGKFCIRCTSSEFLEIEAKFNFYRYHFKKQQEIFYNAFLCSNDIYPPENLVNREKFKHRDLTDDDLAALRMARGIDKSEFRKQIEHKS